MDQGLINAVIEQIQMDIESGDFTAIEELLQQTPETALTNFLSEESVNHDA